MKNAVKLENMTQNGARSSRTSWGYDLVVVQSVVGGVVVDRGAVATGVADLAQVAVRKTGGAFVRQKRGVVLKTIGVGTVWGNTLWGWTTTPFQNVRGKVATAVIIAKGGVGVASSIWTNPGVSAMGKGPTGSHVRITWEPRENEGGVVNARLQGESVAYPPNFDVRNNIDNHGQFDEVGDTDILSQNVGADDAHSLRLWALV
jgi:hypothetical protein